MKDSLVLTNEFPLEDYYASSNRTYIELDDLSGERKITKLDSSHKHHKANKTSLYEIIVQCARSKSTWNNRSTPLITQKPHINFNIRDYCPSSTLNFTNIN